MRIPILCLLLASRLTAAGLTSYDPLAVPAQDIVSKALEVKDSNRGRTIPIRVYLPHSEKPEPVILFSHGLGGSRENNPYLGNHWAKRGYVVVFIQHPGSDESVWKSAPATRKFDTLKQAASPGNFLARVLDIPEVINALATWNSDRSHPLHEHLDLDHVGMAGHSFGAITTQAVAGQAFVGGRTSFRESRIDAAVMMSPSPPATGDPSAAFSPVSIPCLLMTGTRDDSPISNQKAADRLKVFPHLQNAPAWEVVFDEATHMSFNESDRIMREPRNPRYHSAILALTTAFWDAELRDNPSAKTWLNGANSKSILTPEDTWQMNGKAKD